MTEISQVQKVHQKATATPTGLRGPRVSKSAGRLVGRIIAYLLLLIGGAVMLFPMFWMATASFKPEWQIITSPPIWIPSNWLQVHAGNTAKEFPLWDVKDSAGKKQRVIELGTRDYAAVADVSQLTDLASVPAGDLSDSKPTQVGGVILNVRDWKSDSGRQQVVALAKDGKNMVVVPLDTLVAITERRPLDEVNKGKQAKVTVGDFTLQARQLEGNETVLQVGPKSQLSVVAPKEIAASAFLVAEDAPMDPQFVPIGETALEFYALADDPSSERYALLSRETWQPIIDLKVLKEFGLVVEDTRLSGNREDREFGPTFTMPLDTLTQEDGSTLEVVILLSLAGKTFVIPTAHTETLRLAPLSKRLGEPFVQTLQGMAVRYVEDYPEGDKQVRVAIVGERGNRALVAPQSAVTDAFAVPTKSLERVLKFRLRYENYIEAMSKNLGGATFLTFYRNSILIVLLNLAGHYFSVTLVAYGFARLRAPGKNFLFLLLLSTMMLPFPVLLIPTFEIFQKLHMLNTLWPLFIRSFFGNAFLIFLLRQFFMSIPQELEDAARIDGANTVQVLWHVMLPLSKPALATIGIFTFVWNWNSFLEPYVYINSVKLYTVSLGLAFFKGQYVYSFHWLMAAGVAAIMPVILIFFFAQRYFIEGIQLTGLKG